MLQNNERNAHKSMVAKKFYIGQVIESLIFYQLSLMYGVNYLRVLF